MDCSLEFVGVRVVDHVAFIHLRHPNMYAAAGDWLHFVFHMDSGLTCPHPASENPNQMNILVVRPRQLVHRTAPERAAVCAITHPQCVL
jgi:hypothetical protein